MAGGCGVPCVGAVVTCRSPEPLAEDGCCCCCGCKLGCGTASIMVYHLIKGVLFIAVAFVFAVLGFGNLPLVLTPATLIWALSCILVAMLGLIGMCAKSAMLAKWYSRWCALVILVECAFFFPLGYEAKTVGWDLNNLNSQTGLDLSDYVDVVFKPVGLVSFIGLLAMNSYLWLAVWSYAWWMEHPAAKEDVEMGQAVEKPSVAVAGALAPPASVEVPALANTA